MGKEAESMLKIDEPGRSWEEVKTILSTAIDDNTVDRVLVLGSQRSDQVFLSVIQEVIQSKGDSRWPTTRDGWTADVNVGNGLWFASR